MNTNTNKQEPIIIVIDGIIGAGKSTLISVLYKLLLEMGYKVTIVREPVEKWVQSGILQQFYDDKKRWAYTFQTVAFMDRILANKKAYEENPDTDIFIMERSWFTDPVFMDMLHDEGYVTEKEMALYKEWCNFWNLVIPFSPDYFLYLRPELDICMDRVCERNRDGESAVDKQYQQALLNKHDELFGNGFIQVLPNKRAKVIPLYTNSNFRDDRKVQEKIVKDIMAVVTAH